MRLSATYELRKKIEWFCISIIYTTVIEEKWCWHFDQCGQICDACLSGLSHTLHCVCFVELPLCSSHRAVLNHSPTLTNIHSLIHSHIHSLFTLIFAHLFTHIFLYIFTHYSLFFFHINFIHSLFTYICSHIHLLFTLIFTHYSHTYSLIHIFTHTFAHYSLTYSFTHAHFDLCHTLSLWLYAYLHFLCSHFPFPLGV